LIRTIRCSTFSNEILSGERTGLLYTDLVRDKKIALGAAAEASDPGGKYPNLFVIFLVPNRGHTVEENEKECYQIVERLKTQKVSDETLQRIKTKVRASLIRRLDSNSGMADALTFYHVNYGDWRKMFTGIDDIDKVTADDVVRVAKQYLIPETRTVVYTVQPAARQNRVRQSGRSRPMKALICSLLLCAGFASAQTEVRRGSFCRPIRI
jgi:predicted Zn-dependent peptidase